MVQEGLGLSPGRFFLPAFPENRFQRAPSLKSNLFRNEVNAHETHKANPWPSRRAAVEPGPGPVRLCRVLQRGASSSSQESGVSSAASSQTEESSSALSSAAESSTVESAASGESAVSQAAVKEITVKVVHGDGSEKEFPISTEAETLGDA